MGNRGNLSLTMLVVLVVVASVVSVASLSISDRVFTRSQTTNAASEFYSSDSILNIVDNITIQQANSKSWVDVNQYIFDSTDLAIVTDKTNEVLLTLFPEHTIQTTVDQLPNLVSDYCTQTEISAGVYEFNCNGNFFPLEFSTDISKNGVVQETFHLSFDQLFLETTVDKSQIYINTSNKIRYILP